ncbi:TetR/AcrR family transcriptional regulator [Planococcus sp. CAU13]|uniref:TetR/AcrR family transcriptional regulator n=1 Tax=Planococcus sp. CAU13 TaxID=1541197 RepID=UPI00052FE42E|nr:TetR/AcrR family transcriptional regulator [Planococcus sp. CAU13]
MEKFKGLDEEKQQKILDASLKEFAEHGYEKASTNRIVKEAGIGKGMLFYYFTSKKDLYEYLTEYSLDFTVDKYFQRVDTSETDFIERLKKTAQVKMEAQMENKNVFNFLGTFMLSPGADMPPHIQKKYEHMLEMGNRMIYEGIDLSLFRDDVDVEKAFRLIRWSIEGYQNELLHKLEGQNIAHVDFAPYWDEFYEYLDILKKSFYKKREWEQ